MQSDDAHEGLVAAEAPQSPTPTTSIRPRSRDKDSSTSSRSQNACDACRGRKVKCKHLSGELRCSGCAFLGIECTRKRPRRRRGPQNRFAHDSQESTTSPGNNALPNETQDSALSFGLSPSSRSIVLSPSLVHLGTTNHATRAVNALGSGAAVAPETFELCQLAPIETIRRILDDWFDKIHAVAPVLVRRRFLHRLDAGEADTNRTFCGLVASVCSATIATLPKGDYSSLTVERCIEFIEQHQLLQRSVLGISYSVDWCIAMYNVAVSIVTQGLSDVRSYHAMAEAAVGTRFLLLTSGSTPGSWVDQQLLKRLLSLLYVATVSLDLFGYPGPVVISEHDNMNFLRPKVLKDEQLDPLSTPTTTPGSLPSAASPAGKQATEWHGETTSYVPGLNSLSDLFSVWHDLQSRDQRTRDQQHHSHKQQSAEDLIAYYFDRIRQVLDNLPPELRWRGGLSRPRTITYGHDVQIANIFITSFHIRSNILQKFSTRLNLNNDDDSGAASFCAEEHQRIVDDLLEVLYNLPPKVFDANGSSLVPKVRDISAAYLEQVMANHNSRDNAGSANAREKLEWILRKVNELDCWNGLKAIHTMGTTDSVV